jgi:hypothetical protein
MECFVALEDLETYSGASGSVVFTVSVDGKPTIYDLGAIIEHLREKGDLEQFTLADAIQKTSG